MARINKKVVILGLIVLLILGVVGFCYAMNDPFKEEIITDDIQSYETIEDNGKTYEYNDNLKVFLLIGADGSNGDPLGGQADFLSLLVVNEQEKDMSIILIPRDTMCKINVCDQDGQILDTTTSHINMSYPEGGSSHYYMSINTKNAVSRLFNYIPIDNYLTMPIDILKDLVAIFGEGDVVLEDDSLTYLDENLVAGSTFHIDEDTVEKYLRSRDIEQDFSAIDRTNRHKVFLEYFKDKLVSLKDGNTDKILDELDDLLSKCETNVTNKQLNKYYNLILDNISEEDAIIIVPGESVMGSFYDEYHYDEQGLKNLIIKTFYVE